MKNEVIHILIKMEDTEYYEESKEYRTFTCTNCGYSADVFGKKDHIHNAAYNTHECLTCHILIESQISEIFLIQKSFEIMETPIKPRCMMCDETNVKLWDSTKCECPKCKSKMELTRLELYVNGIQRIRII